VHVSKMAPIGAERQCGQSVICSLSAERSVANCRFAGIGRLPRKASVEMVQNARSFREAALEVQM
jgi:hypothetical protein